MPVREDNDLNLFEFELEAAGIVEEDGRLRACVEEDAVLDRTFDTGLVFFSKHFERGEYFI